MLTDASRVLDVHRDDQRNRDDASDDARSRRACDPCGGGWDELRESETGEESQADPPGHGEALGNTHEGQGGNPRVCQGERRERDEPAVPGYAGT